MKSIRTILLTITLIFVMAVPVHAKNTDEIQAVVLPSKETVDGNYFASGDVVTLSGTVNGDAYLAGGTVSVNGTVKGDLFVAGGTVTISGALGQDLRAVGGTITVTSPIPGSITAAGGTITLTDTAAVEGSILAGAGTLEIAGPVGGGITAGAGNLTLGNEVQGNVKVGTGMLSLLEGARIAGDLTYWSDTEYDAGNGATVSGSVMRHDTQKSDMPDDWKGMQGNMNRTAVKILGSLFIIWKISSFIVTLITGLILFMLIPNFTKNVVDTFSKKTLLSIGTGLITIIVLPVTAVLLLVTLIGIPLGALLFSFFGILTFSGHIYAGLALGQTAVKRLNIKTGQTLTYIVGLALLFIIALVPIIGFVATSCIKLVALGAVMTNTIAVARSMHTKKLV